MSSLLFEHTLTDVRIQHHVLVLLNVQLINTYSGSTVGTNEGEENDNSRSDGLVFYYICYKVL